MDKIRQFVNWMHEKGIPIPLLRDYKHKQPSVSYTMMLISFSVCIAGLLGKISNFLGNVDMSQSIILFGATSALYFGRQSQINTANKTVDFTDKKEE